MSANPSSSQVAEPPPRADFDQLFDKLVAELRASWRQMAAGWPQ